MPVTGYQTALITGGNGNIGRLIAERLVKRGVRTVRFDIPGSEPQTVDSLETIVYGDIRDQKLLREVFEQHQPDIIFHLASLLSGSSEADVNAAWEINATASFKLMQLALEFKSNRFFFASTIASYGTDVPDPMPEDSAQWPSNFYGATKVAVERLGAYFRQTHDMDFRCLRFPMVLSPFAPPTAVTAYPSHALRAAVRHEPFQFPVSPATGMSTLLLEDVISSIVNFCDAEQKDIKQNAYNLHAYHFTTEQLVEKIRQRYPDFKWTYQPVEVVENLVSSWPGFVIDQNARDDWGWLPEYDFDQSVQWLFDFYEQD